MGPPGQVPDKRADPPHGIGLGEATKVWGIVAINSFGGPAGQIAVMNRLLVDERRWFTERRFLHALNYAMLLPGPEAQQLATYLGWTLHGIRGGLIAGGLFVLPGFIAILILSILYAGLGDLPLVEATFYGIKPAVVAIVAAALIRIATRALKSRAMYLTAAVAFVAMFFFAVPFPVIIASAGAIGFFGARVWPGMFDALHEPEGSRKGDPPARVSDEATSVAPSARRSIAVAAIGLGIWWGPLIVLALVTGGDSIWVDQGVFFSTAALVTFGGAYAVLAFIAQQAVETYGWLQPGEMLDGLGMAETTPGPLIQVVQFVGFMGAYRAATGLDPMVAGVLAAVLVTWVTFVPCFIWIFVGAPYMETLRGNRRLNSALSTITAAVVGVILNLALWFTIHTLFAEVDELRTRFGLRLYQPDLASVDLVAAGLAAAAAFALFRMRWPVVRTLLLTAFAGAAIHLAFLG